MTISVCSHCKIGIVRNNICDKCGVSASVSQVIRIDNNIMRILVLDRKLEKDEEVTLLTDSTPDNWRGKNGEKLEGNWKEATRISKDKRVSTIH